MCCHATKCKQTMAWRKTIPSIAETVFPGISSPQKTYEQRFRFQTTSSVPLQAALYYNVWFYPVWLATMIAITTAKINCLTNLYRFVVVTVQVSTACIEALRLYLGYVGNLSEKIPEVAAFWMLSIVLQLPLQVFLTVNQNLKLEPIEYTVQGIMLVMLVIQLIVGFQALRNSARIQATRFHVMQMQSSLSQSGQLQ